MTMEETFDSQEMHTSGRQCNDQQQQLHRQYQIYSRWVLEMDVQREGI